MSIRKEPSSPVRIRKPGAHNSRNPLKVGYCREFFPWCVEESQNRFFHSKADFFYTHWKSEPFDKLIDDGLKEIDVAKRKGLYEQADKIINDEAPLITVYHWGRFVVNKPGFSIPRFRVLGRVQGYLVKVPPQ